MFYNSTIDTQNPCIQNSNVISHEGYNTGFTSGKGSSKPTSTYEIKHNINFKKGNRYEVNRNSGITFTNKELLIWRIRAKNGPYKTTGDRFTQSPGAWDEVVTRANKFMNDQSCEFWDGDLISDDQNDAYYTSRRGHYLLAAAFYGLVKEDNTYRQQAKIAILKQISNSNPVFEDYLSLSSWPNAFHFSNFTTRLFKAFDYTYDLWTEQEIADYEIWMERACRLYRKISSRIPNLNFPNRNQNDYSVVSWWALTGQKYTDPYYEDKKYTFTDENGVRHNYITFATGPGYLNGDASLVYAEFLWGLYKNDLEKIEQAKRWVREWLMFAVWPDGTTSENIRNGDYGRPSTGTMWYGAIVLEIVLKISERLRRKGDNSLYEFTTSYGHWGTEGGKKNIRLVVETLMECMRGTVVRYWWLVQENRRLDPLNGTYRYKPEMALALGNQYFKDDVIKKTYMNLASGCIPYNASFGGPYYVRDGIWMGNAGIDPAAPLMYYEMENF